MPVLDATGHGAAVFCQVVLSVDVHAQLHACVQQDLGHLDGLDGIDGQHCVGHGNG